MTGLGEHIMSEDGVTHCLVPPQLIFSLGQLQETAKVIDKQILPNS